MFIPVLPPASPRQNIVPRWGRRPFGMGKIIPVVLIQTHRIKIIFLTFALSSLLIL